MIIGRPSSREYHLHGANGFSTQVDGPTLTRLTGVSFGMGLATRGAGGRMDAGSDAVITASLSGLEIVRPLDGDDGVPAGRRSAATGSPARAAAAPEAATSQAAVDELGGKVKKGLGWSFLNNVISRAGVLIIGIALARMLAPDEFGVFAVALLAMQLLMSLNDAGMTSALIRWQGDIEEVERTGVTMIFCFSSLLYGVFFVTAPVFAAALHIPEASSVLRLLALTIIIDATAAVPTALLTRSFSQGKRTIADTSSLVVWAGLSIGLTAAGFGVWALVWGRLIGNLVTALVIFALAPRRPRPGFDPVLARRLAADGLPLTGSGFLTFCMINVDTAVTGRILGPIALGYYTMAFNLASWPVNMFSFAVRRVSLVGFAQLSAEPSRLRFVYARSLALLTAVTVPVCVLLATLGEEVIETVYGTKWVLADQALRFLALLSIVRVAIEITDDLLVALGKARIMVRIQTLWLVALIPALTIGAHLDGIRGVAIGHLVVAVGIVAPAFCLTLRALGFPLVRIAMILVRPALGGIAFALVTRVGPWVASPPPVQLLVGAVAAIAVYAVFVAPMRWLVRQRRDGQPRPSESHESW
ncbi:lipopolysaccharide biosynthesis protein [Pseudofrankia asymbiotica]|uniref:lipopolysaccharide biosynthesis protein n=1 Tax=Pseudofrankia asymbiotica TaxID=1834516 RepID=UPI001304231E|nr:lipopolysaccharide biosynthesis protein [Pseudofrankia asymbiotica]